MAEPPSGHQFFSLPDDAERRRRAAAAPAPDPLLGGRPRVNAFGDAPGPRDWTPMADPLAPTRPGAARPPGRAGRSATSWLATVVTVLVAGVVLGLLVAGRHRSPLADSPPTVRLSAPPDSGTHPASGRAAAAPKTTSAPSTAPPPVSTPDVPSPTPVRTTHITVVGDGSATPEIIVPPETTALGGRLVALPPSAGHEADGACLAVSTRWGPVVVMPRHGSFELQVGFGAGHVVDPAQTGILSGDPRAGGELLAVVGDTVTLGGQPSYAGGPDIAAYSCGATQLFDFDTVG